MEKKEKKEYTIDVQADWQLDKIQDTCNFMRKVLESSDENNLSFFHEAFPEIIQEMFDIVERERYNLYDITNILKAFDVSLDNK